MQILKIAYIYTIKAHTADMHVVFNFILYVR